MVEMTVREHNVTDSVTAIVPCQRSDVGIDSASFVKRGAAIDQEQTAASLHHSDGDVQKRQPAAVHTV